MWAFDRFDAASREVGVPIGPAWSEEETGAGMVRAERAAAAVIDADAELAVEAVLTLPGEGRRLVIGAARSGLPPDWRGGAFEVWRRRAAVFMVDELATRRAWQGEPACLPALSLRRGSVETMSKLWDVGRNPIACAVVHVDRADELREARRRYRVWLECLVLLRSALAIRLVRWLPTGPCAPAAPWD